MKTFCLQSEVCASHSSIQSYKNPVMPIRSSRSPNGTNKNLFMDGTQRSRWSNHLLRLAMNANMNIASVGSQEENGKLYLSQASITKRHMQVEQVMKRQEALYAKYVPVFVMLPLDVIDNNNILGNGDELRCWFKQLTEVGVDGIMVDVWWGIVESTAQRQYNWTAYRELFELVQEYGFKIQAIMSFHGCRLISLPEWVLTIGESNPDIFFTNQTLNRNKECLSFGVDEEPVLYGRTVTQVYIDFMRSFKESMADFLYSGLVTEIHVGLGPAGELRYPSFTGRQGWKFPGIGEFQCYDKYLKSKLLKAATSSGHPEWGLSGPQDAGQYNDFPENTGFFCKNGTYQTDQGKFFLTWYSNQLLLHGDLVLDSANQVFQGLKLKLVAKVAGIHWWYKFPSHAAELAAGYYNLSSRDGYRSIAKMLSRHHAVLNFTCIEMQDSEQPEEAACGPEQLVHQVLSAGWKEGIGVAGENALERYDRRAYRQITRIARLNGSKVSWPPISTFTYLRLSKELIQRRNFNKFKSFVREMHAGLDPRQHCDRFTVMIPLPRSKPQMKLEELLVDTTPDEPFCFGVRTEGTADRLRNLVEFILDKIESTFW